MEHRKGQFRELIAWQRAYDLVLEVYRLTKTFPDDEMYGLVQQVRRAAVSVPSNIAEGWGRGSTKEYIRYLCIARGSLYELETQLTLAADLGYVPANHDVYSLVDETSRLLNDLIRRLREKPQ